MVKRKLNRMKRAEEKKILSEHEGLYKTLVKENYTGVKPDGQSSVNFKRIFAGVAACITACVICVAGMFGLFKRFTNKGGDNDAPSIDASEPADEINDKYNMRSVNLKNVNAALSVSGIKSEGLKFKSVKEYYSNSCSYYKIEVDSRGSLEITAQINRFEDIPDAVKPAQDYKSYQNEYGYDVGYSVKCRRSEDLYFYTCLAEIDTGREIFYLSYEYLDRSPECELEKLIDYLIIPKN